MVKFFFLIKLMSKPVAEMNFATGVIRLNTSWLYRLHNINVKHTRNRCKKSRVARTCVHHLPTGLCKRKLK